MSEHASFLSDVGAVVVAAGRGERLGGDAPKALVEVAGRALVAHAVDGLRRAGVSRIVVTYPPGQSAAFAAAIGDVTSDSGRPDHGLRLVAGGPTRTASVRAGLRALPPGTTTVAVHDAARAFTPPEVVRASIVAVTGDVLAAAPAVRVADTLKRVDGERVTGTVDRTGLVAVQTPQVFPFDVVDQVLAGGDDATDDLGLVEAAIASGALTGRVVWVPGSMRGLKVTYAADLEVAARLAPRADG